MKKILLSLMTLVLPLGILVPSVAYAHSSSPPPYPFTLKPNEFVGAAGDCGANSPAGDPDKVTSKWTNITGSPKKSIELQKLGPTGSCVAAQVDVITPLEGQPVSNLTELNFDVKDTWHCGAGGPRFNLQLDQNGFQNAFLGCNSGGTQTSLGNGWTHVEFNSAQIAAAVATAGGTGGTLYDLYIIQDEGSDTGPDFTGTSFIDNISVNTKVVGDPSVPRDSNDCKNNGWQNLTDKKGNPFTSQSDCQNFVNNHKDKKHDHHPNWGISNHQKNCYSNAERIRHHH